MRQIYTPKWWFLALSRKEKVAAGSKSTFATTLNSDSLIYNSLQNLSQILRCYLAPLKGMYWLCEALATQRPTTVHWVADSCNWIQGRLLRACWLLNSKSKKPLKTKRSLSMCVWRCLLPVQTRWRSQWPRCPNWENPRLPFSPARLHSPGCTRSHSAILYSLW